MSRAEHYGQRSGNRKEADRRNERDENRAEGHGHRHAGALHDPHRHGSGAGLKGREIGAPRPESAGENHVTELHIRIHIASAHPESQPTAEPVHRSQDESHRHPSPVQAQERRQEDVHPIAEANQVIRNEKSDSTEGDGGEQLEATTQ